VPLAPAQARRRRSPRPPHDASHCVGRLVDGRARARTRRPLRSVLGGAPLAPFRSADPVRRFRGLAAACAGGTGARTRTGVLARAVLAIAPPTRPPTRPAPPRPPATPRRPAARRDRCCAGRAD